MDELNRQVLDVDARHQVQANYEKTLLLLAALKSGAISLDQFNLVPGGWQLVLAQPAVVIVEEADPVPAVAE